FGRVFLAGLAASLLLMPASRTARAARFDAFAALNQSAQSQSEADDARREREEEERERQREREEEKRDREQEKRDREQERIERMQELYDDGRENLDEDQYGKAEQKFSALAQMNGPQTDAALYWKAYAENKLAKKTAALATIADLKAKFPQSKWKKDAEA